MKRRDFLKQSATTAVGATALAAGAAPAIVRADDHASRKNPIIGHGEYRYECFHNVRTEEGWQYLYLSDIQNRQVVKTTLQGEVIWKRSYPTQPGVYEKLEQYRPTNVAFGPDGGFYVGDGYGSHYIHQYDKNANWVRTWGGFGTEPGKFNTPHGLWWDDRPGRTPSLVIADRANTRLQYFTQDGKPIGMVHDVLFPAHFDIRGEVLLVPDLYARVSLFDRDNEAIIHLGDEPA